MKTEPIFTKARVPCSNQDHGVGRLRQDKSVGERNNNLEYAWAVLILKKNGIMILLCKLLSVISMLLVHSQQWKELPFLQSLHLSGSPIICPEKNIKKRQSGWRQNVQ